MRSNRNYLIPLMNLFFPLVLSVLLFVLALSLYAAGLMLAVSLLFPLFFMIFEVRRTRRVVTQIHAGMSKKEIEHAIFKPHLYRIFAYVVFPILLTHIFLTCEYSGYFKSFQPSGNLKAGFFEASYFLRKMTLENNKYLVDLLNISEIVGEGSLKIRTLNGVAIIYNYEIFVLLQAQSLIMLICGCIYSLLPPFKNYFLREVSNWNPRNQDKILSQKKVFALFVAAFAILLLINIFIFSGIIIRYLPFIAISAVAIFISVLPLQSYAFIGSKRSD